MNDLYKELSNNGNNNLISQFQMFKASFQGDPKEQVQELLNSGRMSQETFERLSKLATQLQTILR